MGKKKKNQKSGKLDSNLNNTGERKIRNRIKFIFIFILTVTAIVGIINTVHSFNGGYNPERPFDIPLWKEYQVLFTLYNQPGNGTAQAGATYGVSNLRGNVHLESTQFMVNNPISVNVQLSPDYHEAFSSTAIFKEQPDLKLDKLETDPEDPLVRLNGLLNALPQNYFVIFVGAENLKHYESNNDNFAIINVTQENQPLTISGNGEIIFNLSGEREVLFLDPSELTEFSERKKEFTSQMSSFTYGTFQTEYPTPSEVNADTMLTGMEPFSVLVGGKSVYSIPIKSSDAISELEIRNVTFAGFGIGIMALIFTALPLIYGRTVNKFLK